MKKLKNLFHVYSPFYQPSVCFERLFGRLALTAETKQTLSRHLSILHEKFIQIKDRSLLIGLSVEVFSSDEHIIFSK